MRRRQAGVVVARTVAFVIVRGVLRLVGLGPRPDADAVEIAVLRHQLMVRQRQVARPRSTPGDRLVLATLSRLLPRRRWRAFLVTPATLLRWHRELVARRWTYPGTGGDRRGLDQHVVQLVVRLARENPSIAPQVAEEAGDRGRGRHRDCADTLDRTVPWPAGCAIVSGRLSRSR